MMTFRFLFVVLFGSNLRLFATAQNVHAVADGPIPDLTMDAEFEYYQQEWPEMFEGPRPSKSPAELGTPLIEPFPTLDEYGVANCHVYGPRAPLSDCLMAMTKMPQKYPDEVMACPVSDRKVRFWQHGWCRISLHDTTGLADCIHPHDMYQAVQSIFRNCTEIPTIIEKFNEEGPLVSGYMPLPLPADFMKIAGPDWWKKFKRELFVQRVPELKDQAIGQKWRLGDNPKMHYSHPDAKLYGGIVGGESPPWMKERKNQFGN